MTSTGNNLTYSNFKDQQTTPHQSNSFITKINDTIMNQPSSSSISSSLLKQNFGHSDTTPLYNQVRISPVFDANFGLPTASIAEMAFNGPTSRRYSQTENCSTRTLSPCFNTLTSRSSLVSDSDDIFNRSEQSMSQITKPTSNSNNLLNDNTESPRINFIDDQQSINRNANNLNFKLQNFENSNCISNPTCSQAIYDNFNTVVTSAARFDLSAICQTQSHKNPATSISNNANLDATSLASAIVAAANVAARNRFQHEELINILNAHNGLTSNQLMGINEQNFANNLQELVHTQEMMQTSINVHQLLSQSIANANSNDMFKSATTTMASTMAASEIGIAQNSSLNNYQTIVSSSTPNNTMQNGFSESNNNKIDITNNNCSNEASSSSSDSLASSAFRPLIKIEDQKQVINFNKLKAGKNQNASLSVKPIKQKTVAEKAKQLSNINDNKINDPSIASNNSNYKDTLSTFDDFVTMALNSIIFAPGNKSIDTMSESGTSAGTFNSTSDNQIRKFINFFIIFI